MNDLTVFPIPPLYFGSDGSDFEEKQEQYFSNSLIPYLNQRYGINIPPEKADLVAFESFAKLDDSLDYEIVFLGAEILQNYALEVSDSFNSEDALLFRKDPNDEIMLVELDRVTVSSNTNYRMHIGNMHYRRPIDAIENFMEYRAKELVKRNSRKVVKSISLAFFAKLEDSENPQSMFDRKSPLTLSLNYEDMNNESNGYTEDHVDDLIRNFSHACALHMLESSGVLVLGTKVDYTDEYRKYSGYDYVELDLEHFFTNSIFHSSRALNESEHLSFNS